jgi:hypothetical protein
MPAAIRPYSIAVAPDSSFKNFAMSMQLSPVLGKNVKRQMTRQRLNQSKFHSKNLGWSFGG